jgi:BirA family transcriptional regulator, biotin operon repressor / biotin---[acetyl-CoA-carboxylase] ligase
MSEPTFSPAEITHNLNTRFVGQRVLYYPELDSTMEAARREALWGAQAGTVILADRQIAGRGRLQRTWLSPPGSLAFSVILRPNLTYLPSMVMLASLGVIYAIRLVSDLRPQIKWPNDILINDKKVCGILIENDIRKNVLNHSIIGIGINVNNHMLDVPEIAGAATSLSDQTGKNYNLQELLCRCLAEIDNLYQLLPDTNYIREQWLKNMVTIGQKVQVTWDKQVLTGIAEAVTESGNLLLRQNEGKLIEVMAGDVTLQA